MKKINIKDSDDFLIAGNAEQLSGVTHATMAYQEYFVDALPFVLPNHSEKKRVNEFTLAAEIGMHNMTLEDREHYIVGTCLPRGDIGKHIKILSTNKSDLLLTTISTITEKNDIITVSDNRLIYWLKKYGMPETDFSEKRVFAYVHLKQEYMICGYIHLDKFSKAIKEFYLCFKLWKAAEYENKTDIKKYSKLLGYSLDTIKEAYMLISVKIEEQLKGMDPRFIAMPERTYFYSDTTTIFNLLYHQLACYISRKGRDIDKVRLQTCVKCGESFWASHGNEKYCGKYTGKKGCNKSAAYMKSVRTNRS